MTYITRAITTANHIAGLLKVLLPSIGYSATEKIQATDKINDIIDEIIFIFFS